MMIADIFTQKVIVTNTLPELAQSNQTQILS